MPPPPLRLLQVVWPQVNVLITPRRTYLRTWTNMVHKTHCLTQFLYLQVFQQYPISPSLTRQPRTHPSRSELPCSSDMNAHDEKIWYINRSLTHSYAYLTMDILYLSTNLKYYHWLLALIKTTTQEEDYIYITSVFNPHSFIMLYIEDLFEKSRPSFRHILFVPLQTRQTKFPLIFGSSYLDLYYPPLPRDLTT